MVLRGSTLSWYRSEPTQHELLHPHSFLSLENATCVVIKNRNAAGYR